MNTTKDYLNECRMIDAHINRNIFKIRLLNILLYVSTLTIVLILINSII